MPWVLKLSAISVNMSNVKAFSNSDLFFLLLLLLGFFVFVFVFVFVFY